MSRTTQKVMFEAELSDEYFPPPESMWTAEIRFRAFTLSVGFPEECGLHRLKVKRRQEVMSQLEDRVKTVVLGATQAWFEWAKEQGVK